MTSVSPISPDWGQNYVALTQLGINPADMTEAHARAKWSDEFKLKVTINDLLDLPSFQRVHESGMMHNVVTFLEYRQEKCEEFGFERDVGIHRDGNDQADRYSVSMIYPIRNTDRSYITWYEGSELEIPRRTGTYCPEEDKLSEVERYYFYDRQTYPVMFRVDQWHGVTLQDYGRTLMRWLFKPEITWDTALSRINEWTVPR